MLEKKKEVTIQMPSATSFYRLFTGDGGYSAATSLFLPASLGHSTADKKSSLRFTQIAFDIFFYPQAVI